MRGEESKQTKTYALRLFVRSTGMMAREARPRHCPPSDVLLAQGLLEAVLRGEEGKGALTWLCSEISKHCNNIFLSTSKGRDNSNTYDCLKLRLQGSREKHLGK